MTAHQLARALLEAEAGDRDIRRQIRLAKAFVAGKLQILASARSGKFTVHIAKSTDSWSCFGERYRAAGVEITTVDGIQKPVVGCGYFMDWWESDHRRFGIKSRAEWLKLTIEKRAEAECKLQLLKWVTDKSFAEDYEKMWGTPPIRGTTG